MTKRSITMTGLVLLVACAGAVTACAKSTPAPATAPATKNPREILNAATAAARELKALTYEGEYLTEGPIAMKRGKFEGHVFATRGAAEGRQKFAVSGFVHPPIQGQEPVRFVLATDGTDAISIDYPQKQYRSGKVATLGAAFGNPLLPDFYFAAEAFETILKSESLRLGTPEAVDGVECDLVIAEMPGFGGIGTNTSKLFLGRKDHILRRIETRNRAGLPDGRVMENTFVFATRNLKVDPEIDAAIFRPECPAGFAQSVLTPPGQARRRPGETLPIGEVAPDWTLTDAAGKSVSLESLRGQVVVLDFWATWCQPCKMAMPSLQKLHEKFKDKPVAIFGVNCQERGRPTKALDYVKKQGFTYGQLLEGDRVAISYGVSGLPTLVVIGPDGKVVHTASGFNPALEHQLDEVIQKALPRTSAG